MNGGHILNEVYFDDAHVPARNLVGKEHGGWAVVNVLAGFERSNMGAVAGMRRALEEIVHYCNETIVNGQLRSRDPIIRNRLAQLACEIEAMSTLG